MDRNLYNVTKENKCHQQQHFHVTFPVPERRCRINVANNGKADISV